MPRSALFSAAAAPPSQRVAGRGGANASSSYASSSSPSAAMLMIFGRADGRRGNARDGVLRSGRHATEWCGSAPMRCGSRSRLAVPRAKGGDPLEGGRPSDPTPLPPSKVGVNPRDAKSAGYSSASFSSPPVRVRFKLQYRCHSRQMLAIAGSMAPLGWSFLSIARNPLRWKEGDYWNIEVRHMRACVRLGAAHSTRRKHSPHLTPPPLRESRAHPIHPFSMYVCVSSSHAARSSTFLWVRGSSTSTSCLKIRIGPSKPTRSRRVWCPCIGHQATYSSRTPRPLCARWPSSLGNRDPTSCSRSRRARRGRPATMARPGQSLRSSICGSERGRGHNCACVQQHPHRGHTQHNNIILQDHVILQDRRLIHERRARRGCRGRARQRAASKPPSLLHHSIRRLKNSHALLTSSRAKNNPTCDLYSHSKEGGGRERTRAPWSGTARFARVSARVAR